MMKKLFLSLVLASASLPVLASADGLRPRVQRTPDDLLVCSSLSPAGPRPGGGTRGLPMPTSLSSNGYETLAANRFANSARVW